EVTEVGWDGGRYYTRSKKVNGRVVREYVGTGRVAELVAQMDAIERRQRQEERDALRAERAELDSLDAPLDELNDLAELLTRAALLAAGFRQHKRGEWRKRRVQREEPRCRGDPARPRGAAKVPAARPERRRLAAARLEEVAGRPRHRQCLREPGRARRTGSYPRRRRERPGVRGGADAQDGAA